MNKKFFIVLLIVLNLFLFTSCGKRDESRIINYDEDVDTIFLRYNKMAIEYEVTGEEKEELISLLLMENQLQETPVRWDVHDFTNMSYSFKYKLTINVKGKFLKKDYSYTVSIGRSFEERKKKDNTLLRSGFNGNYVVTTGYNGEVSDLVVSFLNNYINNKETIVNDKMYNELYNEFVNLNYNITELIYLPSECLRGFNVNLDNQDYIVIYQFKTIDYARKYVTTYSGKSIQRIWYGGSSSLYQKVADVMNRVISEELNKENN